jgi:hypothetical protein
MSCDQYKSGMLIPLDLRVPCTNALGMCRWILHRGRAVFRSGRRMSLHCALDRVVAVNGYSSDLIIVALMLYHASIGRNFRVLTPSHHWVTFCLSNITSSFIFPSGRIIMPSAFLASYTSSLELGTVPSWSVSSYGCLAFCTYDHFPLILATSTRYQ